MQKTPLRQLRERRELKQGDLARALGISQSAYSRIERFGQTTKETAAAIIAYLGRDCGITELEVLYPERFIIASVLEEAAA